ncbi:MAG: aspartyl/glutamyl-tRNA amidotransferase subunit C [Candidatus Woesebacteria bacterium GW2011_GWF1_40_24]|uniref:Aspartyl/glutamyl-tRNA(Asn/Gln) amidotransferase subunit C n=7 Tax=Candidatus Woeseibacteriota TaxID=1752722 RepID=A0A0G0U8R0_9BACT|nr:MAG: aspartyl/glutamyl-tRNA amidotransferase subunit C [Candidatus Woesebacteria bacterium GW2011_GWB1_40_12]KKR55870.1 MAG: aspartyl/glutamyl-tRNA amidotransferase subunit C [Candidatus Woesebacteria bacterium GW2011_GWF1_40_24]KKR90781.1 MAG: aspartyl/glutamyl-tRNA amidotransferase subunit C [Candidatus Woesebacteria bacterium GW2011_GWD1_41_12]KKS04977.1 MAG: aspartyl/glutamyl-tRNA amidotransferase subunit C [Candidatus Woesebacteria bacterium GW2011_GWE1_41_24]
MLKSLIGDIITENMVKLNKEDVLHVAKLAKLNISDQEIDKFTPQLSNVINYFGELSEVDTEGVEPTSQTTGLENVSRPDNLGSSLSPEEAISGSDKIHNGYFKVGAVLTERTDK